MTFHPDNHLPGCMMPDGGDCCVGYQALLADWRRLSASRSSAESEHLPADCDWPNEPFKFHDDPGEHDPCYVVMPGGVMLPLNHHAGEGVDIARAKFIVAACNAALAKGLTPSPMAIEVIVTEAMQERWNDICSDTGCHPLDIKKIGRGQLEFHVSHWARQVGKQVAAELHALAQPSPLRMCGMCHTWNSKPCGEQCGLQSTDPTYEQMAFANAAEAVAISSTDRVGREKQP